MDKLEIINQIQKTAITNNGAPLGKLRFLNQTGIKETDWRGIHWAKWSDALIEAGFSPNKKQGAYDEGYLMEKYAVYTLELGHAPTSPELQLKAKRDNDFPSESTFQRRLGSKKSLIGKLIVFCNRTQKYSKILDLIKDEPYATSDESIKETFDELGSTGYVYLMKFGSEYKIGTSNNVERRFRELKTQMPYKGDIIHTITTGDPEGIERYWHDFFKENRLKGEWFHLNSKQIKYFKKRKLM